MTQADTPLIIVSGDGHVSGTISQYAKYLAKPYRDRVYQLARENEEYLELFGEFGRPEPADWSVFDTRGRLAGGGELGAWDLDRRLEELDGDGIAGELLLYGTQFSTMPFFSTVNHAQPAEVRWAGAQAYNRWVQSDMLAPSDGRLYGCLEPGPCHDMDATIRELAWGKENGFVAVYVPGATGDKLLPALTEPYWAPFWSACEDLGLVLLVHAGWGRAQEEMHQTILDSRNSLRDMNLMELQKQILALDLAPRSVFWKLVLGGVFDRHPGLKLALVELRSDWIPATLAHLDDQLKDVVAGRPSDYFKKHVFAVPSSIHRVEVADRHEVGVRNIGFGADYPHYEGTWPNTLDWFRDAMAGVPEEELRAIAGENAIDWFGLDRKRLAAVAERIAPTPAELFAAGEVEPTLIQHFDKRSAYLRPAEEIDTHALTAAVAADLVSLTSLSSNS